MKIRSVGAEMFRLGGWTDRQDRTKLIVVFSILQTHLKMSRDNSQRSLKLNFVVLGYNEFHGRETEMNMS